MWACPQDLETCLPHRFFLPWGLCCSLAMASEGGGSSYSNVHQMADLKTRTAAPGGGKQHLCEEVPLER